jgi:hypothetical protein
LGLATLLPKNRPKFPNESMQHKIPRQLSREEICCVLSRRRTAARASSRLTRISSSVRIWQHRRRHDLHRRQLSRPHHRSPYPPDQLSPASIGLSSRAGCSVTFSWFGSSLFQDPFCCPRKFSVRQGFQAARTRMGSWFSVRQGFQATRTRVGWGHGVKRAWTTVGFGRQVGSVFFFHVGQETVVLRTKRSAN